MDVKNAGSTAVEIAALPMKTSAKKSSNLRPKSHPPTSQMVNAAIKSLKDRKGSSLQAIKKYMATTYKVDGDKFSPFIKRYLKSALTSGTVVQTKGKGASGSFKLPAGKAEPRKIKVVKEKTVEKKIARKPVLKKPSAKKVVRKPIAKKTTAKQASPAKVTAKIEIKSISKSKKAKAPATKAKAPKPKKALAKSVKTAKK